LADVQGAKMTQKHRAVAVFAVGLLAAVVSPSDCQGTQCARASNGQTEAKAGQVPMGQPGATPATSTQEAKMRSTSRRGVGQVFSIERVRVGKIVRVEKHPSFDGKPAIVIELYNPDVFYVGGLYWALWIGDQVLMPAGHGHIDPKQLTKEQQDELFKEIAGLHIEYYAVSEQAWDAIKDGAPLALTWGNSRDSKRHGLGKLDKSKLQRQK
jgi:hypothetical protein